LAFKAVGFGKSNCPITGLWHPGPAGIPPPNELTFLENGTLSGIAGYFGNNCNFSGNYRISALDNAFVWSVDQIRCAEPLADAVVFGQISEFFCLFDEPTGFSSTTAVTGGFNAGCYAAFTPDCQTLQFSFFDGNDAGPSPTAVWVRQNVSVPRSCPVPPYFPLECHLAGIESSTIPGLPLYSFAPNSDASSSAQSFFFNITYFSDWTYISSVTYRPEQGSHCSQSWRGTYLVEPISGLRYPYLGLYRYSTVSGHGPTGNCSAIGFTKDPASCIGAVGNETCFLAWDAHLQPSIPRCSFFRLIANPGYEDPPTSGPLMGVLKQSLQNLREEPQLHPFPCPHKRDVVVSDRVVSSSCYSLQTVWMSALFLVVFTLFF